MYLASLHCVFYALFLRCPTETRALFEKAGPVLAEAGLDTNDNLAYFGKLTIVVSDGINTSKLLRFNRDGHSIDVYGIGTNLATCQEQPSLGMVYKLVDIDGEECMKLSSDPGASGLLRVSRVAHRRCILRRHGSYEFECAVLVQKGKILLPGRKKAYRLFGSDGKAAMDVLEVRIACIFGTAQYALKTSCIWRPWIQAYSKGSVHTVPAEGQAWKGSWPLADRAVMPGPDGVTFT